MNSSLLQVLASMLAGIVVIIVFTTKLRLPAFFAILLACFVTGIGIQLSLPDIISTVKAGFGNTLQSLGIIVILGTSLGLVLEHTGCTTVMANYILKKTGDKHASLAMSLTGFIVGLPIFCDSGYIVLNGLNKSMIRRTGIPAIIMSVSLASGLYSVHCLLPPHPGAAAAASTIGVDYGRLILYGLLVAVPVMFVAHAWSVWMGKKIPAVKDTSEDVPDETSKLPSVIRSFLPIIVPILLISFRSFFISFPLAGETWFYNLLALGDPVMALAIALLLALNVKRGWTRSSVTQLLNSALEKAGTILMIIGAGGAFGAILSAAKMGEHFAQLSFLSHVGLFFPFLLAFILKTAQGSSTVAIMTAASIILPLLPALGLDTDNGRLICVLALGAGSMMVSHANDAYFWVIAQFSGIEMKTMLRVYSTTTCIMGCTALAITWLLSLLLL